MPKMWAGVTSGETEKIADDFNSSISFDKRLFKKDIEGSIAHAGMLLRQAIISQDEAEKIIDGLNKIKQDIISGQLEIDMGCEDIHMFVEQVLTERIGQAGKKLHTARSRNDQVALDIRLYLMEEADNLIGLLKNAVEVIADVAEKNIDAIMPGYTHLQHAQPILFSHQLLAYAMMLLRDIDRFEDYKKRVNVSPIGACALAGTTYDTDRKYEASLMGFDDVCMNSIDAVSDRDFCVEFISCASVLMMHLSRFAEELILWSSQEFAFIEFSSGFTTGSSIMPQKRNPDMAELIRGKTGRVYGNLMSILTVLKGLPLAYNKDMQEDKEPVFDTVDTVKMCLEVITPMLATMTVKPDNMFASAQKGFMNATDLADYLVVKGMPFRDAYKISGKIVAFCVANDKILETMPIEIFKEFSELIDEDVYEVIDLAACVNRRRSLGGTSRESVEIQINYIKNKLETENIK